MFRIIALSVLLVGCQAPVEPEPFFTDSTKMEEWTESTFRKCKAFVLELGREDPTLDPYDIWWTCLYYRGVVI